MQRVPSADDVRALVRPLDQLDRKVLGGLLALLMTEPARIRDREWVAQQFVQLAVVAHGFDGGEDAVSSDDVELVQLYAERRMPAILPAMFALFVRVADDLRARGGAFALDDAQALMRDSLAG